MSRLLLLLHRDSIDHEILLITHRLCVDACVCVCLCVLCLWWDVGCGGDEEDGDFGRGGTTYERMSAHLLA